MKNCIFGENSHSKRRFGDNLPKFRLTSIIIKIGEKLVRNGPFYCREGPKFQFFQAIFDTQKMAFFKKNRRSEKCEILDLSDLRFWLKNSNFLVSKMASTNWNFWILSAVKWPVTGEFFTYFGFETGYRFLSVRMIQKTPLETISYMPCPWKVTKLLCHGSPLLRAPCIPMVTRT